MASCNGEHCKLPHCGLGQSASENRIWCILALMICRSGQTSKVPNNCQAVSGVTVRPSYCAGISSVSYCSLSLLTKPPNTFCRSVQMLICQKPNFQIPLQMPSPAQCHPARGIKCLLRSPIPPPLCTSLCP